MKRVNFLTALLIMIFVSGVWAQDGQVEFLYSFLRGTYQVIGRWPDSNESYSGKVIIKSKGDHLQLLRSINGEAIEGIGRIATVTFDKIKVLRVEFSQRGRRYKATYMIDSDLDNYARLTGHLYLKTGETKRPGLEALFIDRQSLEEK
jgi:ribosomal protein L19